MEDIKQRCAEVMAKVFKIETSQVNDETSPDSLMQWDSLSHVQMLSELEKSFSVKINPEEGINLETFKMICDWVEDNVRKG